MDVLDFFDTIDDHPHLYGLGQNEKDGEPHLFIECPVNNNLTTEISASAVEDNEWDTLQDVLMGEREPQALYHMTRVCGYCSRVENWNASKKGELLDRQKGDYAV